MICITYLIQNSIVICDVKHIYLQVVSGIKCFLYGNNLVIHYVISHFTKYFIMNNLLILFYDYHYHFITVDFMAFSLLWETSLEILSLVSWL